MGALLPKRVPKASLALTSGLKVSDFTKTRPLKSFPWDALVYGRGGPRLSEISCTYDPPIYDITSGCRLAALFSREAQRWTPDAIWFSRCFYPQANGIMYLECRES